MSRHLPRVSKVLPHLKSNQQICLGLSWNLIALLRCLQAEVASQDFVLGALIQKCTSALHIGT